MPKKQKNKSPKKKSSPKKKKSRSSDSAEFIQTVDKTVSKSKISRMKRKQEPVPLLTVLEGPSIGQHLIISDENKEFLVGRTKKAGLVLEDDSVSRNHAMIKPVTGRTGKITLKIEDLESTNGTFLNGKKITKGKASYGDRIYFGEVLVRFDLMDPLDAEFQSILAEQAAKSRFDPLTGLLSKRFFMEEMPGMVSYYTRKGIDMALLMTDIDHFKKINDTYGHQQGDSILILVSEQILKAVRNHDPVVRYGGEEILVLLRSKYKSARRIAERIRKTVAEADYSSVNPELKVTISVGGALAKSDDSLETLIERADQALYDAKKMGRNMVVWSD